MSFKENGFRFGDFFLNSGERILKRNGIEVQLTPKAIELLTELVKNPGVVISKNHLMDSVWADSMVEEANLPFTMGLVRKALGDDVKHPRFIETLSKKGYRFIADVDEISLGETNGQINDKAIDVIGNQNGSVCGHRPASQLAPIEEPLSRIRYVLIFSLFSVVILGGLAFYPWPLVNVAKTQQGATALFQNAQITKLSNGKALNVAVSPDGKQVAYVLEGKEGQSLWLRRTAVESGVQIIAPANVEYLGVNFSRDGDTIYYVLSKPQRFDGTLYSVPVLGGLTRKLVEHIGGPIGLSHDGTRLAFIICRSESEGVMRLLVASTDGSNVHEIYSASEPLGLWDGMPPAWSPDDRRIAILKVDTREVMGKLIAVSLDDSTVSDLTGNEWRLLSGAEWTKDGLFISGPNKTDDNNEIWQLDPTRPTSKKLTNYPTNYEGISLDRDGRTLGTIQNVTLTQLWSVPIANAQNFKQITSGSSTYFDVTFTPQGKLLFASRTAGLGNISQMNNDDTDSRDLTKDAGSNYKPLASPDGRYMYFQSNRGKTYSIYRSLADGSDVRKLADDDQEEDSAACSPDGKTIVFHNYLWGSWPLKKVSSDGGTAVVLNDRWNQSPAISPDGKLIAVWHAEAWADDWKLALIPLKTGGDPIRSFSTPWPDGPIRWTRDGRGLLYIVTADGVSNIWRQNINGDKPFPITKFQNDRIFSFDLSPDGKTLVCSRGVTASDVVLLGDV